MHCSVIKNKIIQNEPISHSANRLSEINTCTNALTVTRCSEMFFKYCVLFNQVTVTQVSCDQTVMRASGHSWV